MEPSDRETRHRGSDLFLQLLWTVGALGVYVAGATTHPLVAVGALAGMLLMALPIARLVGGWRAVAGMFGALALQAPLLCGLGLYALSLPLGHDPWPCFFWHGTSLQLVEAVACVVALSSPIGFMLRLDGRGLRRLRQLARMAAPMAAVGSAVLIALGGARLMRLPTPDHYLESLPVHATIPAPRDQPCTPIEDRRDPKHESGWERAECATPDFDASPLSFHYHVAKPSRDGEATMHELHVRTRAGQDREAGIWFWRSEPPELPLKRDDSIDAWILKGGRGEIRVVSTTGPRWSLYLRQIRQRISPPLGWSCVAIAGLLVALGCFVAGWGLGRLTDGHGEARREWLAARRGDLSLVALASALCSSALLAAALFAGFLT